MTRFLMLLLLCVALPSAAMADALPFQSARIVVETRGQGPDIILIPGLASTGAVWQRTANRLERRYRVHRISVRGFGPLAVDGNDRGPLNGPVAAEVERYIAEQGLQRPAIIGHSMGGQIALRVAADAGPRVGRVMVVDASPFFPALISPGATVGDVEPIARVAFQAVLFFGDDALRLQGRAMGIEAGGAADSLFRSLGWQGGDRRLLAQGLYEVMTLDLRSRLPDITAPVTVVYGWNRDGVSPRAHAGGLFQAAYASLRSPARFEPIEGAEHMVMIDQPTRFAQAVERFLD